MMLAVRAPGRVNLIGEHTDYNDGFVLPAAIDLELRMELEPTDDGWVDVYSAAADGAGAASFALDDVGPPQGSWVDYVAGVAAALAGAGWPIGGFRGRVATDLPLQVGLSSSAALELLTAWGLLVAGRAQAHTIDRMALGKLCQRAENEYVGVRCGLMDQFAVACGVAGQALMLDCRSLDHRTVRIPDEFALVVVDTGRRRPLLASNFNERRAECERAAAILAAQGEPVTALRDATVAMLDRHRQELGESTYRRCRHVVEENERVLAAADALESADRATLSDVFAASHASLRDLFEVSCPELDAAVEVASATPGVIAARMTGAGFGGCTVNLVERDAVGSLRATLAGDYEGRTGLQARVYGVEAANGAGPVGGWPVA